MKLVIRYEIIGTTHLWILHLKFDHKLRASSAQCASTSDSGFSDSFVLQRVTIHASYAALYEYISVTKWKRTQFGAATAHSNGPAAIFVITSICSGHIRVLLKCSTALWLAAVKRFIKALITRYATSSELHFPVDKPPFLFLLPFASSCCRKRLRPPPQVWCLWQVNKSSLSWAFKAINSQ